MPLECANIPLGGLSFAMSLRRTMLIHGAGALRIARAPSDFNKVTAVLQARRGIASYALGMRTIDDIHRPGAHDLDARPDTGLDCELTDCGSLAAHPSAPGKPRAHRWQVLRAFARARESLHNLRLREASKAIAQIGRLLAAGEPALHARYESAFAELRACVLVAEDDLPRARELLLTSRTAPSEGTLCATLLRYIDWMSDARTERPEQIPHEGPSTRSRGRALERILNLCLNAALEFEHLRPTVAGHLAAEALRVANERYGADSPASSLPAVLVAQIAYEQGRLTEAEGLIGPRAAVIRATGVLECILRACLVSVRIAVHQGRNGDAFASLRDVEAIGRARGWPRLVSAARAEHARILLVTGQATDPEAHTQQRTSESGALTTVRPLHVDVLPRYSSVQAALARVTSASSDLETEDRGRILMSCLRIGATRGLLRVFVDAAPIRQLLESLYQDPRLREEHSLDLRPYIGLLLRAAVPAPSRQSGAPIQPLSRREKAILRMIAQGMCNKRIAQSLGIAPETVKSHAKSIFLKLRTRTRAQAVARAASLDLSLDRDQVTTAGAPRRQVPLKGPARGAIARPDRLKGGVVKWPEADLV